MEDLIKTCDEKMQKSIASFENELAKTRTGKASISILDKITVDYYGSQTPLNQVASLTTPDSRTIVISPFEKKIIQDIERAIMIADLGIQPSNDGNIIRLPIPILTEERRKQIVKSLKKTAENAKISVRHIRRDSNEAIKKLEKDKEIEEDISKKGQERVQKSTDQYIKIIDEKFAKKEQEVLKV